MRTKLLGSLFIFICSCSTEWRNEKDNSSSTLVIDLFSEPVSEITNVSDISTDLNYIPLQTTENSLMGSITKILTRGNKLYIKTINNKILAFDNKGNFLTKLDAIGKGPGEYPYIADFDVSSDNETLLILSSGRILVFTLTGKDFLYSKSLNLNRPFPSKIDMIPETTDILLSVDPNTGTEPSLSLLINIKGDTLLFKPNHYKFEKVDKHTWGMPYESLHYEFGKNLCFKEEFSDTVYSFNRESQKILPRLIFNSHGKGYQPKHRYDSEYAKKNAAEFYWVFSILEVPRYVVFTYENNSSHNKMVYDKSTGKKYKIALKDSMKDDIAGGPAFDPLFCSEGKVYSTLEALTLKKYVAGKDFENAQVEKFKKKEELKRLANSLEETDNPVLVIMSPKK